MPNTDPSKPADGGTAEEATLDKGQSGPATGGTAEQGPPPVVPDPKGEKPK